MTRISRVRSGLGTREWTRAALLCLALVLAATALDRRTAILDRIEPASSGAARASQAAQTASVPTPEAMVREMMTHD